MEKLIALNPEREFIFEITNASAAHTELRITNIVEENLAFKIKTTLPKFYVVKPNTGIIKIGSFVTISITLQPIPSSVKDHKFMLQVAKTSLSTEDLKPEALISFWRNAKDLDKGSIEEHKLKVALKSADMAQGSSGVQNVHEEKMEKNSKLGSSPSVSSAKMEIKTIVEEVEEQKIIDDPDREIKEKIRTLNEKHDKLIVDVSQKEHELKELKDKETQDDNKAHKAPASAASEIRKKMREKRKSKPSQFHMMHLLIAILSGLFAGIIIGKILF
jgi:hypothetical protein